MSRAAAKTARFAPRASAPVRVPPAPRSPPGIGAVAMLGLALSAGCVSESRMQRSSTRVDLGAAYLHEQNPEAAIAALREAVKLDPRNWRAKSMLAMAYIAKGQPELAE
jgi:Tfp pilus assembly protein PilF